PARVRVLAGSPQPAARSSPLRAPRRGLAPCPSRPVAKLSFNRPRAKMPDASRFSVVVASDAARRRARAAEVLSRHAGRGGVTVIGATRDAADELVREVARHRPATFGLSRFSLAQLAIRVAGPALAARGIAPSTPLGFEAVAARAVFDLQEAGALGVLAPAAGTPGFP